MEPDPSEVLLGPFALKEVEDGRREPLKPTLLQTTIITNQISSYWKMSSCNQMQFHVGGYFFLCCFRKVEDEMEDMVRHLTHQLQEISVELESLHKQLTRD